MKDINYRLIVSDFDGTLITSKHAVPKKVRAAINGYVSRGGIFAVCTGRMLCSILPRVREMGLKGLVAAYQGTVIAEIESGKIIRNGGMSFEETADICRVTESLGYRLNVYSDSTLYTSIDKDNRRLKLYESITGVTANNVGGIPVSQFVLQNRLKCQKVTVLVKPEEREELYGNLLKTLGGRFDVTCSADVLVEVSPAGDNKGAALGYIAQYYNIPLSSTVAVGDNLNDLPMIEAAGCGVAVGNADERLKRVADDVTVTNDNCAVAEVIKKYGYKKYRV